MNNIIQTPNQGVTQISLENSTLYSTSSPVDLLAAIITRYHVKTYFGVQFDSEGITFEPANNSYAKIINTTPTMLANQAHQLPPSYQRTSPLDELMFLRNVVKDKNDTHNPIIRQRIKELDRAIREGKSAQTLDRLLAGRN